MPFVNAGACTVRGAQFATKSALRRALAADPHAVMFLGTSPLGPNVTWPIRGDEIPPGIMLSVVGPDPSRKRDWYATVSLVAGKVKFK